ncbi:hypothetical protein V2L05_02440 [Pseudomonas alliivorans]|nr:hypothetical protein [Pseudomonas alliivorans]MEE4787923.1 hypothetical protein [Pseudomonas alliivorans]MEE4793199.1 hypothetical protein [Pseudomonas alliivorans]MEE4799432.1 hypothetical protein [Pseudomonas alliivorans]MEE4809220.1 hypothetical protein [Pseudomonas alliivorans]
MMTRIFLSASVPRPDRGDFHETADPFLIQFAVRELMTVALGRRQIVWGGHPAITPMIWAICSDLGVTYSAAVHLFQSRFFSAVFPEENDSFSNFTVVDAVEGDRAASLVRMREQMLAGPFHAAVFIGGMEGVLDEYELFVRMHPNALVLPIFAPGGAAQDLAKRLGMVDDRVDFARLFSEKLGISQTELRNQV